MVLNKLVAQFFLFRVREKKWVRAKYARRDTFAKTHFRTKVKSKKYNKLGEINKIKKLSKKS